MPGASRGEWRKAGPIQGQLESMTERGRFDRSLLTVAQVSKLETDDSWQSTLPTARKECL